MLHAECEVGMIVRDTRNGKTFKVLGHRLHATDSGAWIEETETNVDGVKDMWITHWSHLEPVQP